MSKHTSKSQRHGFSRSNARKWGISEAIVLRFLAYHIRRSKNIRHGKHWYYNPVAELAKRFPYLSESGLDEIIKRLVDKRLIEVGSFNRKSYDRTRWYTTTQEMMDAAEEDAICFDDLVAAELGIPEAVLLNNLRSNIAQKRKRSPKGTSYQRMTPNVLKDYLPFSKKTIERALKKLRDRGLIVQKAARSPFYTLPPPLVKTPPKLDKTPSELDEPTSKLEESTSKVDNNTHCKPLENTIVKDLSKEAQAEPDLLEIEDAATFLRS